MKLTFSTFSFGCRVNQAEIEAVNRRLIQTGFKYNEAYPDFYIINTCAVTSKAEREVRQHIYQIKKKLPKTKIVITGCAATYWIKNRLFENLPVDLRIANSNKNNLPQILKKISLSKHIKALSNSNRSKTGRVFIKIQDGCHRHCSYCIVPYLRGLPHSRRIDKIIDNIKSYDNHIQEAILTAINTEAYGLDTKERFVDLLRAIIDKTNVPRISLGSIHPFSITHDFIEFIKENLNNRRLVKYFHIPIQSGSDKILKLMNRGYNTQQITDKLNLLHKISPQSLIATDIIVGFPGETDRDFEETYKLLQKSCLSKVHIFRFSKRCGTSAYNLVNQLSEPLTKQKIERSKKLSLLSQLKYRQILLEQIGRTSDALFLNKKTNGCQIALLDNQLPVFIKTDKNLNGKIKNVEIVGLKKDNLFGKIV